MPVSNPPVILHGLPGTELLLVQIRPATVALLPDRQTQSEHAGQLGIQLDFQADEVRLGNVHLAVHGFSIKRSHSMLVYPVTSRGIMICLPTRPSLSGGRTAKPEAVMMPARSLALMFNWLYVTRTRAFELLDVEGHALPSYGLRSRREMDLFHHFDFFNANTVASGSAPAPPTGAGRHRTSRGNDL